MTDEQINIAIAEHCGFTDIIWPTGFHQQMSDEKSKKAGGRWRFQIPNYYNDLNAIHEAEKGLDWQGKTKFTEILYRHCPDSYIRGYDETEWDEIFPLINSTARQRAEAFVKTIGKWEDS
jgi:hypothetical protein